MQCPECNLENPPEAIRCAKCAGYLVRTPTISATGAITGWSTTDMSRQSSAGTSQGLQPGSVLAGRYEILQLLGKGGMGAVYKAMDREVDRPVAIKVIRPDLANETQILRRFKQELILARQVTHKNVIRIFDLGEADGIKFISMDYIDGQDLRSLAHEKGKLTPEEAASIIIQVCGALDAAHAAGVVHRDLKPQNILVDKQGRATVMDFGIARSMEVTGMTQTGALLGTPEYMSPEQAKGEEVDARSDLFTVGIIFYELLTGKLPYQADTLVATLLKRTQQRARPPIECDPAIPRYLNDVVVKCLEIDPRLRYQKASEILADLEKRNAPRQTLALRLVRLRMVEDYPTRWIAPALAATLLLVAGVVFRGKIFAPTTKPSSAPTVSLAIIPFRNASGDPALDWLGSSVADMLSTDVGQSNSLRTISSDRMHQILHDLRLTSDAGLDSATLQRLAEFSNAQTIVSGQYARFGNQIRIDASLRDLRRDRTIPLRADAPNENGLPAAIDELAQDIRKNLPLSASIIKELEAQAFKPSTRSLAALRNYDEGLQLLRQGRNLEAQKKLAASTQQDPQFALAFAKLAEAEGNLGHDSEAERSARRAVELSEALPPQEKYRIAASHAQIMKDYAKAIESYENLAQVAGDDPDVQFALGVLYENKGVFDKAREHFGKVLKVDPKYIDTLLASGRVEIKSNNAQTGLDYLNRALTLAIQVGNDEERALILQATGIAYRVMNKPEEALNNYKESLKIQRRLGQKRGVAASLNEMAQVYEVLGKPREALASFNEAIEVRREIGAKKEVGDTLIDLGSFYEDRGQHDRALQMYKESLQIQREAGDETYQALCLNNIGGVYEAQSKYDDALTYFQQALQLREKLKVPGDIADTLHNLAETNARMGSYEQALSQYLRALDFYRTSGDKRGAAVDSHALGILFGYQGRYGAALNAEEEALKIFRELQDRSVLMLHILTGYGEALSQIGRGSEAEKTLEEAMSFARELKNDALLAQVLNLQGGSFFYRGDFKMARVKYDSALRSASQAKDANQTMLSKFNLARLDVTGGRFREAISHLKAVAREADRVGLKYLSAESSVSLAEALVNTKAYPQARHELETALMKSEKLGLRALGAKIHYLLGTTLRLTGNETEAARQYGEALRLLGEIRKEKGTDKLMERSDLSAIFAESSHWSQGKPE